MPFGNASLATRATRLMGKARRDGSSSPSPRRTRVLKLGERHPPLSKRPLRPFPDRPLARPPTLRRAEPLRLPARAPRREGAGAPRAKVKGHSALPYQSLSGSRGRIGTQYGRSAEAKSPASPRLWTQWTQEIITVRGGQWSPYRRHCRRVRTMRPALDPIVKSALGAVHKALMLRPLWQ
jgi:hypothetical protein